MPLPQRPHQTEPLLILGETTFRSRRDRFGLLPADRLRHLWVIGKTGSGKSTLLANLILQDLARGTGLLVLDPHGDLIDTVLPFVPPERTNDVLVFNPADRDFPVSFNVFRQGRRPHEDLSLFSGQLVTVFKRYWADSWGPRLEHILRNAILAVAPHPQATLVFLYRFLTDEHLREEVIETVQDPLVRQFWTKEFAGYGAALKSEAVAPVLNKLGAFVANPIIRNIVGQERSRVDLIDIMSRSSIVFAPLPTGRIGEDASHLLGGLLLTAVQLAAMARPRGGPTFMVYADEFQHFVTDSVATILAESRKFGLGLVLAHQYLGQLTESVRLAVLGNVGSTIIFRIGGDDALALENEFNPPFTALDLTTLPAYHSAVKLIVRGEALTPFSSRTLPLPALPAGADDRLQNIRRQSRARYAQPRESVERLIADRLGAPE
jgi:hypothetical protein